MFGYQLVKRFPSPGYEVWEDWREHYLSTDMKLGWTEEEMVKWLPTKLCGWALNAVSDLPRGYWRPTPVKQAWRLTETLHLFDIRLSDNPLFYERSYNLFVRGKAGSRAKIIETSDTVDQKTRPQFSQRQVIDTNRSVGTSLLDAFRQPGKSSEGCEIGSSSGVSKGAFSKDLFGEVEDTRVAESSCRISIRGYDDEVRTGTEIDFTEEICGQVNQGICKAELSENDNSGNDRKFPTKEKINERSVESYGPVEHHAMENDYVLSPESEELRDEQSDDDYLFEDISDTEFSIVEDDVNEARSETSFAGSLDSVACDNVTALAINFGGGVKASRNHLLGAWALMELKTGGSYQKFCNALRGADETQMCTTEPTVDTLENWTSSG